MVRGFSWYHGHVDILKFVGQKLGPHVGKSILNKHLAPEDALRWETMLFGSQPEKTILPKIEEMQKQLKEIQQTVEQTQVHTLFQSYNASKVKVNVLTKQMKAAAEGRISRTLMPPWWQRTACSST